MGKEVGQGTVGTVSGAWAGEMQSLEGCLWHLDWDDPKAGFTLKLLTGTPACNSPCILGFVTAWWPLNI